MMNSFWEPEIMFFEQRTKLSLKLITLIPVYELIFFNLFKLNYDLKFEQKHIKFFVYQAFIRTLIIKL